MRFYTLILAFAATALAIPRRSSKVPSQIEYAALLATIFPRCLTLPESTNIVNMYATLLIAPGGPNFNVTAETLLAPEFSVYSDSINSLSGRPLGVPAYASRAAFIAGQAQTPALPNITTQEIFNTCDRIAWRWTATEIGSNQYPVQSMITFNVNTTTLQLIRVNSEFNTLAFSGNLGYPECAAAAAAAAATTSTA